MLVTTGVQALLCCLLLLASGSVQAQDAAAALKAGDAAISRGEYNAALKHYSLAAEADPMAALVFSKRAAAYTSVGEHKLALRDLSTALDLDATFTSAYLNRARLLRNLCEFGRAEADLQQLRQLKPGHKGAEKEAQHIATARTALDAARSARQSGDAAATRAQLGVVLDAATYCSEAKLMEVSLLMEERDYSGVAAMTGQIIKAEPGHCEALTLRGQAYFYLDDMNLAKRHFGEVLQYDPDHKLARAEFKKVKNLQKRKQQGDEAMAKQDWLGAEHHYIDALWIDENATLINTALWLGLCKAQYHLGKGSDAVGACQNVLNLNSELEEATIYKIRARIVAEEYDLAIQEARHAHDVNRGSRQIIEVLREAEKAKKMAERKDYYKIMGVAVSAAPREIKKKYRDLARQFHPDKADGEGITKEEAEKKFMDLAEAYEVLSDEEKRARYDAGEDIEVQQQAHPGFHHGFGGQTFHFQWG